MTPDKNAPMAVFLSSDAAKDVTGQVFGTRMNEIILFSSPRPVRIVHRADGWTPESIVEHAAPALKATYMPLDRSGEVFHWDPLWRERLPNAGAMLRSTHPTRYRARPAT